METLAILVVKTLCPAMNFFPCHVPRLPGRRALAWILLSLAGCHATLEPPRTADDYSLRGIGKAEGARDFDGAIADFNRALALRPDDADVYYNLGLAKSGKRDRAGAIAAFDRALALRPRDPEGWLARGGEKFSLQDYDAAIADFDRAIALDEKFTAAYYSRALARRRQGDFDGAFADYDRALAIDPDYWLAYNSRATTHNAHGDFELAILDYEKRIELQPEGSEYAWFQRSLLLRRLGRDGDMDNLAREIAGWPEGWTKTVGQFLLGRLSGAELLRRATETADAQTRREQECEANYYVGITALLAGRRAEAREKFTACMATGVNVFLEFTLARAELARLSATAGP